VARANRPLVISKLIFLFHLYFVLWREVLEYPFSSLEETIQQNLLGFDTTAGSSLTPHQLSRARLLDPIIRVAEQLFNWK